MSRIQYVVLAYFLITVPLHATTPPTGRYKTAVDKLLSLQATYATVSSVFSIGVNDEGTPIMAMRISTSAQTTDPKKIGHLVVATHHGDEGKGVDLAFRFLEKLLDMYLSWELYRNNLADIEWTVIPVLNISGYNANQRREYGHDPNRDYPGPCTSSQGGKLASIRALMQLLASRIFTGTITIHGYIGTLTYPWGVHTSNSHSLDHNAYAQITSKAAEHNGYRYGTSTDLIYPANGTYEDFVYWKYGIWSLLVELRNGSISDVENTADAMLSFFDQLDSSPSTKNQMTGNCLRNLVDLHLE